LHEVIMSNPDQPEQWEDNKPHPPGMTPEQKEDAEGAAAAAGTVLGCVGFSLLPGLLLLLVIVLLVILWAFHGNWLR
jgi:hypothetical protein